MCVKAERMVGDFKALGFGHSMLPGFNFCVVKLFHPTAIEADHVVMVLTFIELIDRFTTFEVIAAQNAGLLKLGQNAVDRGQADIGILIQELAKDIFG